MRTSLFLALTSIALLGACQTDDGNAPTTIASRARPATPIMMPASRTLTKPITTGPGILLFGWGGTQADSSMTQDDRVKNQQAEARAYTAPIGQLVTWQNADTNHSGTVAALRDSYDTTGAYCREFQQTITIDGPQKQGYVKACQLPNGTWQVVK